MAAGLHSVVTAGREELNMWGNRNACHGLVFGPLAVSLYWNLDVSFLRVAMFCGFAC